LSGSNHFVGAIDVDYTFQSSVYLHFSYLFNSEGINSSTGNYFAFFLDRSLTAQTLSPAMHNIFGEISYQFSPIISVSMANMINPSDGSAFIVCRRNGIG